MAKNLPAYAGETSSIPGLGRSPGERNGNPLQYSCLRNPMDRGGVAKSQTQLSVHPGGPVVKNPCFHGCTGSVPGWGTKIPHVPHSIAKNINKNIFK